MPYRKNGKPGPGRPRALEQNQRVTVRVPSGDLAVLERRGLTPSVALRELVRVMRDDDDDDES